ncbi:hypothetical protein QTP88_026340 [Uroleucon formosanum]
MLITKILMTLPDSYRHYYSAWDSMNSANRTLEQLTIRLMVEETRQVQGREVRDDGAESIALTANKGKIFKKEQEEKKSTSGLALIGVQRKIEEIDDSDKWYVDSNASDHMTNRKEWFVNYKHFDVDSPVRIGDDIQGQLFCEPCIYGKQHKETFTQSETMTTEPGQIIHSDVCGPMEENSLGVQSILNHLGIKQETSVPYTPEQNGRAERSLRTICEVARTMIYAKNFPKSLWAKAVNTVVFSLNYTDTSKGYRIWYKENNEVSLSRDVIFKDESVVNDQLVEYSNNLNDSNNIDVLSVHKDGSLEHSNKPEGDEVIENEFGPINVNDNEKQEHEQGNGSNVNVYNLRDRSNIKIPLRYNNSAFFVAESDPVNFKEAVESQKFRKMDGSYEE